MSSAADQLADRLDQVLPPQSDVVTEHDSDPLVDTALRLARSPHPALGRDQVARIESLILARVHSGHTRRPIRTILYWAAAACLIITLVTMGTAQVSAGSLPGETFYPVKRFVERGRLALSSDKDDVDLRLEFADRRLDEFETLLDRGTINLDPLHDAIKEMNSALALVEEAKGSRDSSVQQLMKLSSRQVQLAEQAKNRVDATTAEELYTTAAEAEQVAQEARDLLEKPSSNIPPGMLEQSSARRLPMVPTHTPEPSDRPTISEPVQQIQPPVETPVPPADDPVFVGVPPVKKVPPKVGPTSTPIPPSSTPEPTIPPTDEPTSEPPTDEPIFLPTDEPTSTPVPPTEAPIILPTDEPTPEPPTDEPTLPAPVIVVEPTAGIDEASVPEIGLTTDLPAPTDQIIQPAADLSPTPANTEESVSIDPYPTETPLPTESAP